MRHRLVALLAIALAAACAGCFVIGKVGDGPVTSESRTVAPFTAIEVGSGIGLVVTIGPAGPIEVQAQANILPIIATDVQADTLMIHGTESFTATSPVQVRVTTPSLTRIKLSGGSSGQLDGLSADALAVVLDGGSGLTVTGSHVGTVDLAASGGSRATLEGLTATDIALDASGGSSATLTATGVVRGSASGGSHVTVSGGATLDVEVTGGANVERTG